ncbi:hypothetical protein ACJDU8_18055 [Clostridium sp. WILCCON 0269]|uniref:Uncharacterized protein n=1 Tax=Candidatus Clostridium eludens TaxID=3381663 RepID=A0ABW8SN04_9CLOT
MLRAWISDSKVQLEKSSSHKQTPPEPKNHLINILKRVEIAGNP